MAYSTKKRTDQMIKKLQGELAKVPSNLTNRKDNIKRRIAQLRSAERTRESKRVHAAPKNPAAARGGGRKRRTTGPTAPKGPKGPGSVRVKLEQPKATAVRKRPMRKAGSGMKLTPAKTQQAVSKPRDRPIAVRSQTKRAKLKLGPRIQQLHDREMKKQRKATAEKMAKLRGPGPLFPKKKAAKKKSSLQPVPSRKKKSEENLKPVPSRRKKKVSPRGSKGHPGKTGESGRRRLSSGSGSGSSFGGGGMGGGIAPIPPTTAGRLYPKKAYQTPSHYRTAPMNLLSPAAAKKKQAAWQAQFDARIAAAKKKTAAPKTAKKKAAKKSSSYHAVRPSPSRRGSSTQPSRAKSPIRRSRGGRRARVAPVSEKKAQVLKELAARKKAVKSRGGTYAVTDEKSAAGRRMKAKYLERGWVDSKSKFAPAGMKYNKDTFDPTGHKRKRRVAQAKKEKEKFYF